MPDSQKVLIESDTDSAGGAGLLSCGEFFDNCLGGLLALIGSALSVLGIILYMITSQPTTWEMAIAVPAFIGVVISLLTLLFGHGWVAAPMKMVLQLPALFALAFWDLPFWADFLLSAYVVFLVIVIPVVASMLGDVTGAGISVMTWITLLLSLAIYGMKFLFEWVYVVALVVVITLFAVGFFLSLLGVVMAPRRGTDAWQVGWTGMMVSAAGAALAISGYTVSDAVVLLPPW